MAHLYFSAHIYGANATIMYRIDEIITDMACVLTLKVLSLAMNQNFNDIKEYVNHAQSHKKKSDVIFFDRLLYKWTAAGTIVCVG